MGEGLLERLGRGEILVCDGSMGATLSARGCPPGRCPEAWSLEHPDVLAEIHQGFIDAGADVILTNTLGGSRPSLARFGLGDETVSLNRRLAEALAALVGAAPRPLILAGNVGPTGELLEPLGTMGEAEMVAGFADQIRGLVAGGAEVVFVETMSDLGEALCAVRAAREVCELPVLATMAFNPTPRGYRTMMGIDPARAAEALLGAGVAVVGANCGSVVAADMPGLVRQMRAAGARHVAVEPNAGLPQVVGGRTVFPQSPEEMAAAVPEILEARAALVGGCCGTTPEHIRRVAEVVRGWAGTG